MTSRDYSSDAKEVNILIVVDCLKSGLNLGVFNIAIYGKTVRCCFNSFEQCIYKAVVPNTKSKQTYNKHSMFSRDLLKSCVVL